MLNTKYIFVTGGVISGLGKGITAASLGRLLKARGLHVTLQKFDPYINIDPGRMSPYQHGEVFVTDDGAETDLDIGHYERFTDENLSKNSNITAGRIYFSVITKEQQDKYDGKTVQVIPHITDEIKRKIYKAGNNTDVVITEIGGTVGDIESLPFIEAIRQVAGDVGRENCMYIHVTLLPALFNEQKTKPTQHSVKQLLGLGIQPDIIVCRSETALSKDAKDKIGLFCNIPSECVIENLDVESLYEIPLCLEKEGLGNIVCKRLSLPPKEPNLSEWTDMALKFREITDTVTIGIVGKYVTLPDAYLSLAEALRHAGIVNNTIVGIRWLNSELLNEENAEKHLGCLCGIVVPNGFGERGIEGKMAAINYARINNIPFFGIGLGMELACVEFAKNVLCIEDADSTEFNKETKNPIVEEIDEIKLGVSPCKILKDTRTYDIYEKDLIGQQLIYERHRRRYEVSLKYKADFEENGLKFSGISLDEKTLEIVELPSHKWFIGTIFSPQFKSRPTRPHPLFADFIKNCRAPSQK